MKLQFNKNNGIKELDIDELDQIVVNKDKEWRQKIDI